jgi:2-formylbenzoate dehydrogenase
MARELEAGYVWVNEAATHFPGTPFGGMKESGVGREEAADEIASYAQVKSVHVRLG